MSFFIIITTVVSVVNFYTIATLSK